MEDEPEKYQSQFSDYIKKGIEPDNIEELLKKVHSAIRAKPLAKASEKQPPKKHKRLTSKFFVSHDWTSIIVSGFVVSLSGFSHRYNLKKLTYEERKAKLVERLNALNSAAGADDDEDDEEWFN